MDNDPDLSLLCQEDEAFLDYQDNDSGDHTKRLEWSGFLAPGDEDEEYVEMLIQRETTAPPFSPNCSTNCSSWLKHARTNVIDWILDRRESFGFHLHTAYLSITYFDRFLAIRSIDDGKLWAVRLLSMACLLLAAKMEEYKVPAASDLMAEDFAFNLELIRNMELLILTTLEWKLGSITPFSYLHHLFLKFYGESRDQEFFFKAMELVLAVSKDVNLVHYRPSVIAAAAVLATSSAELTRKAMEIKTSSIPSWDSQDNEHIFFCYNLTQKHMKQRGLKTPRGIMISQVNVLTNPSLTCGRGVRRRLPFHDGGQNCPVKRVKRQK